MTLHPSTFQLSHSCHNTIFDRIGGAAATPAAKQVRESQRFKKLQLFVSIASKL